MGFSAITAVAEVVKSHVESAEYKGKIKDQSVYKLIEHKDNKDTVKYVGRTNDPGRRADEHKRDPDKKGYDMVVIESGLTLEQARL